MNKQERITKTLEALHKSRKTKNLHWVELYEMYRHDFGLSHADLGTTEEEIETLRKECQIR